MTAKRAIGVGGVAVIIVVCYVLAALSYKNTDGAVSVTGTAYQYPDGLLVTAFPVAINPATDELTVRLLPRPQGSFVDAFGQPTRDITIWVVSYSGKNQIRLRRGQLPAAEQVILAAEGRYSQYPFDAYKGTLEMVATTTNRRGEQMPIPLTVLGGEGLAGWQLGIGFPERPRSNLFGHVDFNLSRPYVTKAFVMVVLILFVLIGLVAVRVGATVRKRRRAEAALLGWGAALLFAFPALRNNMPGAPPIGAWMDVLVFVWALLFVIVAYLVVVMTWVRT